jgi:hypothetical protein
MAWIGSEKRTVQKHETMEIGLFVNYIKHIMACSEK